MENFILLFLYQCLGSVKTIFKCIEVVKEAVKICQNHISVLRYCVTS